MPLYSSSYGLSEEIEAHIQKFLFKEFYECKAIAEKGRAATSKGAEIRDAIGRMAMSALRVGKQKHSIEYLKRGIRSIGCIRDTADIARSLGYLCRYRINTLLELSVSPKDGGDRTKKGDYYVNLYPGTVGLPDISYYSAMAPGKSNVLYAYMNLLKTCTKDLDMDDVSYIVPVEARFAAHLSAVQEEGATSARSSAKDAVDLTFSELESRYRAIPWKELLTAWGIPEKEVKEVRYHVDYPAWLEYLDKQMTETPLEQWYSLFSLHTLLHALPYLPPPFDDRHFALYGKLLSGQKKKVPQDVLALNVVKEKMSLELGHRFVELYLTPDVKRQALQFVRKIQEAAMKRIEDDTLFSKKTRELAAEKIRAMGLSLVYSEPAQLESAFNLPPLQTDNFLVNIYLVEVAATEREIQKLLKKTPEGLWYETPYSVNAYYYHETNEIVVPAGSFFWPFYNRNHGEWAGWNYGGLGAVIGHEIVHAFDQEGKQFDATGAAKTWWSGGDEATFREKTRELVQLYDRAKVLGRSVNGAATLNENLADLGGLAIALDALKREIQALPAAEKKKQLRDFFVSYAVSWRTKEHPEKRLQRLILDKHAPVELRVNLIVSQFEEWYEAFDVQTADTLYIPPEERIRIF